MQKTSLKKKRQPPKLNKLQREIMAVGEEALQEAMDYIKSQQKLSVQKNSRSAATKKAMRSPIQATARLRSPTAQR